MTSYRPADTPAPPPGDGTPANMKKIAVASVIGTTVEWYDLFVFATASALVFNKVFFPGFVPLDRKSTRLNSSHT